MAQMSALIAFNPNTTILSADTNSNNTTIRSTYNAHDVATTAVHGVSTGTLAYWLSSGDFGVNATNKLFLDGRAGGGDTYITEASANTIRIIANTRMIGQFFGGAAVTDDYFSIQATSRFYLDGGSDTYITEASANTIRIIANTRMIGQFFGGAAVTDDYFSIQATSKLYFDGGGDTYIYESAANVLDFFAGGVRPLSLNATQAIFSNSTDVIVGATKKFYLDGGSDTYIYESAANTIRIIANTRTIGQFFGGAAVTDDYFSIQATSKLYFDGGSDTYEVESSANVHDTVVGGTIAHRINSAGETLMPAVDPPTANYANRNSFVKAWGYFTSAGATDAAYNCSCTYSGAAATGYTVTWNTDFSSVNYAAVAQIKGVAGFARIQTQFAGTATVILYDASGVAITSQFSIMAAGGQ